MKDFKAIDLTHTLSSEIPTWDGGKGFELSIASDYQDCTPPDVFRTNKIVCGAGIGTHMDAPSHCFEGKKTIADLDMEDLATDCIVIDVSEKADESYLIAPEDVENFEKTHGVIPENSFVIFYTGWGLCWEDREKYINGHTFPSVAESTAQVLVERNIAGLGIDTLSADTGKNGFPVHRVILGAGKYLVENIANAAELPPTGAKILVLPMKIKDATEAPIRLVAIV